MVVAPGRGIQHALWSEIDFIPWFSTTTYITYHQDNHVIENGQEPHDFTRMWGIKQKTINEQTKQTRRHRQQTGGYQRRGWGEVKRMKGGKYTVMVGHWILGGERTLQYIDDIS